MDRYITGYNTLNWTKCKKAHIAYIYIYIVIYHSFRSTLLCIVDIYIYPIYTYIVGWRFFLFSFFFFCLTSWLSVAAELRILGQRFIHRQKKIHAGISDHHTAIHSTNTVIKIHRIEPFVLLLSRGTIKKKTKEDEEEEERGKKKILKHFRRTENKLEVCARVHLSM